MHEYYAAFNRGDLSAVLDAVDESFEVHDPTVPDFRERQRGSDALRALWALMEEAFEDVRYEVEDVVDLDSRLLVRVRASGRGKGSGIEIGGTMGHVWSVSGDKAVRLDVYGDWDIAVEAVGLRE